MNATLNNTRTATHLRQPEIERFQLLLAKHRSFRWCNGVKIGAIAACIHHKESYIPVREIEVVLSFDRRVIVCGAIVQLERLRRLGIRRGI